MPKYKNYIKLWKPFKMNEDLEKQVSDLEEKRDIERIANVFGMKIKVEIV